MTALPLHDLDLLLAQAIKLIHQPVDALVRGSLRGLTPLGSPLPRPLIRRLRRGELAAGLFGQRELDRAGRVDLFGGVEQFKSKEPPSLVVVENQSFTGFVAFRNPALAKDDRKRVRCLVVDDFHGVLQYFETLLVL